MNFINVQLLGYDYFEVKSLLHTSHREHEYVPLEQRASLNEQTYTLLVVLTMQSGG